MTEPKRKTRRKIAYWAMGLISVVVVRALFFPDLGSQASALLMVTVPSLVAIVAAFIGGETYSDHSQRKNGGEK